jgi:hypothetical protein
MAWLLLACWLPATSHCVLEVSGIFDPHGCCSESVASPISKAHFCSSAFPTVEAQDKRAINPVAPIPVLEPGPLLPVAPHGSAAEPPIPCASPPEFLKTWNHYASIALPARAPSSCRSL